MKLTEKELRISLSGFLLLTSFFCVFLEELNQVKGKGDVKIYGIIITILYFIYGNFLLYFLISTKKPTSLDTIILWVIFILLAGLAGVSKNATQERLDTFHFITVEFVMFYILYLYQKFYKTRK